ncbi:g3178 [Coccomyxa elongata]
MASKDGQTLPTKEGSLFRQVVKFYETKQYKKAIKAADQVLKKFPDHGETLAMKGLTLNNMDPSKKEEAYELARRGIKNNLKSHVTWHVYGLLYRGDQNYDEAIKCYKNALRIDKENYQILRDLSNLQIQMRDISGFVETRTTMLGLKASNKSHWISFAIAHHLNGSHQLAAHALKTYEDMQEEVPPSEAYEHSEMILYRALVLEEGGQTQEALAYLDASKDLIKDRIGLLEQRGRLLLKLPEEREAAEDVYRKLLALNPDNHRYHEGLRAALQLEPDENGQWSEEQLQRLEELYDQLAKQYSRSNAVQRIPLNFKVGVAFEDAADAYVRKFLNKGIPSLFSDLKAIYRDPAKRDSLGSLMQRLLKSLENTGFLPPLRNHDSGPQPPGPQAKLWALYYLAQHYDKLGQTGDALAAVQRCIEEAPDLPDVYTVQSRIAKHAGDLEAAVAAACKAESLDLADRYLNSSAAKALFRAGRIEDAEAMAAKFTKHGDQLNGLTEMQCMWYEIECGNAYMRRREYGKALKKLLAVVKHFEDFQEDQFDFHSYCVRKMTLRAYVEMLRMEDNLHHNVFYSKAAWAAIQVYLELDRAPASAANAASAQDAADAKLSPEELKRLKQKRRKEQQKQKKEAESAAAAQKKEAEAAKAASKEKGGTPKKQAGVAAKEKDTDPDGDQLAKVADPLAEAVKLVRTLKEFSADRLQTHLLAFEVYLRRGKLLLALQAVKRALQVSGANHPQVHCLVVRFCQAAESQQEAVKEEPVVAEVINSEVQQLLAGKSLAEYNQGFLEQHGSDSLLHRAAAAEMMALLDPNSKAKAVQVIVKRGGLVGGGVAADALRHADAVAVHALLQDTLGDSAAAQEWKQRCSKVFRWSGFFEGADRLHLDVTTTDTAAAQANGVADAMKKVSLSN